MLIRFKAIIRSSAVVLSLLAAAVDASAQSTATVKKPEKATARPSANEIINRYIEAIGGRTKLSDIKSQTTTGTMSIPAAGLKGELEMYQKEPGEFFMQVTIPGVMTQQSGSDGKTLWESSNITGAEVLTGPRAEQLKLQMKLFPSLEMSELYDSIECTGEEQFAGEKCYQVVTTKKGLPPATTYYSVATGLQKGELTTVVSAMGEMKISSEMKTYREQDGVKFAEEVEATLPNGMKQVIKINKIEFNTPIEANKFQLPADVVKSLTKGK